MLPIRSIEGVCFPDYSQIDRDRWPDYLTQAVAQARADWKAIVENPDPPSFENTFEALERRDVALLATHHPFNIQAEADATDQMTALNEEWSPIIEAMETELLQDPVLFQRCKLAFDSREGWTSVQERLAVEALDNFIHAGAALEESERERLLAINVRLAELQVLVQDKLNAASREELVFDRDQLDGVDEAFLVEAAEGRTDERFAVRMLRTRTDAVLANCRVRETRQAVFEKAKARNAAGSEHDTTDLIAETLALRQEATRLLGFTRYSERTIADYMAKTPENVERLLLESWGKLMPSAMRDIETVREAAINDGVDSLAAWDVPFYTEVVRLRDFAIDTAQLKAYLPVGQVRQAAFDSAGKLFGIGFELVDAPTYHDDAKAYLVRTLATGEAIGGLVLDYRSRGSKGGGAWMGDLVLQHGLDNGQKPVVVNVCSFGSSENLDGARLDLLDAATLFHELGHALHGLLTKARYPSQSGTNVLQDWVELPSQLMENWINCERGLIAHARHADTGEQMPPELAARAVAAGRFGQAFQKISYLQSALLDMAIHGLEGEAPRDLAAFSKGILEDLGASDLMPPWHELAHFSHLFAGGYAAGYYSYLWAEVMEADVFNLFEGRDLFDPEVAQRIHQLVYSIGDEVDPADLFRELVGREPSPEALMTRLGAGPAPRARAAASP